MSSRSLDALTEALEEVRELQEADPTAPGEIPGNPRVSRVVGRASVILLSSHFERYIYSINEEAVEALNDHPVTFSRLPERLRLLHSRPVVEALAGTAWDGQPRVDRLGEFVELDSWLWGGGPFGALQHKRLLVWMRAPTPENLTRYYRFWSIQDIFSAVAESPAQLTELRLRLTDLVDKRNAIAHGDVQADATKADIDLYLDAVISFCSGADGVLSDQLIDLFDLVTPW
jgi:hypothetical protein